MIFNTDTEYSRDLIICGACEQLSAEILYFSAEPIPHNRRRRHKDTKRFSILMAWLLTPSSIAID